MLKKYAVAIVVLTLSLSVAHAQSFDRNPRLYQFHRAMLARAAGLKAAWIKAHGSASTDMPVITSGEVLTPTVNATSIPNQPSVSLKYKATNGLRYISILFQFSTTNQTIVIAFNNDGEPKDPNPIVISTVENTLSRDLGLYNQSGQWNVSDVFISDQAGNFNSYSGADLNKIFNGKPFFNYNNNVAPDSVPPTYTTGKILTRTISLSSAQNPLFQASLNVADTISGVNFIYVFLQSPSGPATFGAFSDLPSPASSASVSLYAFFDQSAPIGTWTISGIDIFDLVGNQTTVQDPAVLKSIFGNTTFKVTQ